MNKKVSILVMSIMIIFGISFYYFNYFNKTEDTQLRNHMIEIEKNMALTHVMKMPFDELVSQTEPYIHSYYKETYFDELKKAFEHNSLLPYLAAPPYYSDVSKVYTSKDNSYKQIFIKSSMISAINATTREPVAGTRSQIAKLFTLKKENDQWKVFSIASYHLSIDLNKPKHIIERFTNYNNIPIEYESIKVLD